MRMYKGARYRSLPRAETRKRLPARGQRTRSNARTKRGARKTVGSFRKDELNKQTTPSEEK